MHFESTKLSKIAEILDHDLLLKHVAEIEHQGREARYDSDQFSGRRGAFV